MKKSYVYILSNPRKTVLYTGVTQHLGREIEAHKNQIAEGFTRQYNCRELVYYEITDSMDTAISRRREIDSECRLEKEALIEGFNPEWKDLSEPLLGIKIANPPSKSTKNR